ncbi:tyrosine-type recombinase/integrase [Nocardia acidivorans]|uniref:tyrosine-type recombinase/integrase n=1 Tax=Nocardia acidivorans TaxID=404580 RepID=UPI000A02C6F5|nr:tyrosine-type recombinase/integrase [Nocardia acidivorans]
MRCDLRHKTSGILSVRDGMLGPCPLLPPKRSGSSAPASTICATSPWRSPRTRSPSSPGVSGLTRGPFTLHQLRHSKLTHAAEDGASTPMLMRMSGHSSVRSLVKYARPSAESLMAWQAKTDPPARLRR